MEYMSLMRADSSCPRAVLIIGVAVKGRVVVTGVKAVEFECWRSAPWPVYHATKPPGHLPT